MKKIYKFLRLRKINLFFLCSAFLLSGNLFGQLNGTYTIGTNGTEDYTSFTNAVIALTTNGINGNVVFNVSTGNYNEQISIPEIVGASETDTIVFQSASGDTTDVKIYHEPAGSGDNFTINFDGVDYITFKDLTIASEGASDFGTVITINNNIEQVHFIGNHFIGKTGTVATHTDKTILRGDMGSIDKLVIFNDNKFDNCGEAMRYENTDYLIFCYNTIINDDSNKGLYFFSLKNSLVEKNTITGVLSLYFFNGNTPVIVRNNIVKGYISLYEAGFTSDNYPLQVYNNFIRGGLIIRDSKYAEIFNNTVYNNSYYPIQVKSTSEEIKILNNIFYADNPAYPAILIDDIANIDTLDFNNLYAVGTKLVTSNSTDYATLADWQAAVNQSAHSYNVDINFVDAANTDLHIADGEPDLYGTTFTGIVSDIDGDPRNKTTPNIGADEYTKHPLSGTYTIGKNGTEDYVSFSEAVESLVFNGISGSTSFNVSLGTYKEQISIPEITGASETDTIIFQSASGDTVDVKLYHEPAGSGDNYTINFDGVDYITFQNLTIASEGASDFGTVITINNNIEQVHFIGNHFIGKTGTVATHTDKTIVRGDMGSIDKLVIFNDNKFDNCGEAMHYENADSLIFCNNTIINDDSNKGLYFFSLKNSLVEKNAITGVLSLYFFNGNTPVIVRNNIVKGYISLYEAGFTSDNYPLQVYNNFVRGGIIVRDSKYAEIFNNTVYHNSYYPIWVYSTSSEIKILNNIFYADNSFYPAILIEDIASIDTLDFNNLYATGSTLVTSNSIDYATLAEWQAAVNQSANSYNVDINFVDAANVDLHIADGEPDLFGTTFTGIVYDIDGESRHATDPNIGADEYSKHPLSGTYTIGTNGTEDFTSFTKAIDALVSDGVSGNTTFNVSSGTYDEQIIIPAISGTSETASVLFQSATGNREDVILTYTPDPGSNYIVKLDGADYIYFQKMTFQVGGDPNYGTLILMDNGANYNAIMYCDLIGHETSNAATTHALIYSTFGTSIDEMNIITNNNITNGSFGVYFTGIDNASMEKGNEISNNVFIDQHEASVYLYYQDSCVVKYDSISNYSVTARTSVPYGIYLKECKNENIYSNYIIINAASGVYGGYGLYVEDGLGDIDNRGVIYNNAISVYVNSDKVTLGITLRNSPYRDVIYNSVNITGSYSGSQAFKIWGTSDWYVAQNNIFSNQAGGYAIYSDISTDFASDYNDIYSTGTNLAQHVATTCTNLSEWQIATSKDGNSLSADPQFVSDTDLHIYHANSDLNGAGTQIASIDRDIDYDDRDDTNPDIGADEYDYISDQNDFLTYSFTEQTGAAEINVDNHTVSIEVAYGTNLASLVATFTISENATVAIVSTEQVSGVTENDFSSPVTYTITAEDASEQNWIVTVTEALNDENDILTFSFAEQSGDAVINDVAHTVNIEVVFGTDVTALVATFTLSPEATAKIGTTDQVSGTTPNDFTSDVTYTIHAEDGTTQDWIVTVTIDENTENDILTFSFPEQNDPAVINATDHTVQIELVPGSSLYGLTATFTLSENAHAYVSGAEQTSGTTANDFDTDVVYTIIAHDDTEQDWTVSVSVEPYHGNDFLTFSFVEQTGAAVIDSDNHMVDVEVAEGTNLTSLVASFTISDGATIDIDGTSQASGVTENDFSTTVSYDITAEDGTSQIWVVNVTVEDNSTGIEDMEELEFVLYPNPATDYINIKCNSIKNELIVLEIFDITGKVISSKQIFLNNDLNITFNFNEEVPTGIYLLNISTKKKSYTQRFIIR